MSKMGPGALVVMLGITVVSGWFVSQEPPARRHTKRQSAGISRLEPSRQEPVESNRVTIQVEGSFRLIRANGIPAHKTGTFPNRGNPHRIVPQNYVFRIAAQPQVAPRVTPLGLQNFGIAINGVPFDPGAAEWYLGERQGRWQYEALSGSVPLGLDGNYGHVQPTGAYHYHGLPEALLASLHFANGDHSALVGWAADGFPIYAVYGFSDPDDAQSPVRSLKSSYRIRKGNRPQVSEQPGGRYDGTFVSDYEYVEGAGDLDECNGRYGVTPEYPDGTYAYFLTRQWPVIPRHFRGTPSVDFQRGPGRRRRSGPDGRPPGKRPPRRLEE